MGLARTVAAAFTVLVGGMPLGRLGSITIQNNPSVGGNTGREKAISSFDIPHNLALSAG